MKHMIFIIIKKNKEKIMKKLMLILLSMFILVSGAMAVSLAKVKIDEKWGFINENGDIIIEPKFDEARDFSNGFAVVVSDFKQSYINSDGKIVAKAEADSVYDFFENGLAAVGGKFIDKNGKIAIKRSFANNGGFSEGLAPVMEENGNWGYINEKGNFIIKPKFRYAYEFSNGLPAVQMENMKYGLIDKRGNFVVKPKFDYIENFGENGLAIYGTGEIVFGECIGDKGFINKNGEIVIKAQFYDVNPFSKKRFSISRNRKG